MNLIDPLSVLENSGILETATIKDSNTEHYAEPDNILYKMFEEGDVVNISKWHHYFEIYHQFFNKYRNKKGLRVLEIGVCTGGSLQLWRKYFDPSSTIIGVDFNPSCRQYQKAEDNIYVRIGDQADPEFLQQLVNEFSGFDIIIDDGGHTTNQQITSFAHLYPVLDENGVYLVEDLHTNCWPRFKDRKDQLTFLDLAKALTDRLYDPYMKLSIGKPLRMDNPEKLLALEVSRFYAETRSISFFDSIVVFCKGKRGFPKSENK